MIRAEGFDPKTMSVRVMDGGTTVLVFNEPPTVPEIDGGMAAIAIGLTVGVVALVREYRRKK